MEWACIDKFRHYVTTHKLLFQLYAEFSLCTSKTYDGFDVVLYCRLGSGDNYVSLHEEFSKFLFFNYVYQNYVPKVVSSKPVKIEESFSDEEVWNDDDFY